MKVKITEKMVKTYIDELSAMSKASFIALAGRMGEPADSLDSFVRRFLESTYNPAKRKIIDADSIEEQYKNKSYSALISLLQSADVDDSWEILGPQSPELIDEVEKALTIRFPDSLKAYFIQVGGMENGDYYMPSINLGFKNSVESVINLTEHLQRNNDLPLGYFCLEDCHDRAFSACLDLKMMEGGECPVIIYDKNKKVFDGVVALNFDLWFRAQIYYSIESIKRFQESLG